MFIRTFAATFVTLALAASTAHAASVPASAPVSFDIGDDYLCVVANTGAKELSDVVVSVTKTLTSGPEVSSSICAMMTANGSCGVASSATSAGFRFCTATGKGSMKPLRGKLCNTTTGECSELR